MYVPGLVKVTENDPPVARVLDSNETVEPGSETTVWSVPSWLIQVTLAPDLIVISEGLKAKFLMTIAFSVPVYVAGGAFEDGDDVHPAAINAMMRTRIRADQETTGKRKFIACTVPRRL